MNNSTIMKALLFDFYGELLTEKQRECFDLHYNEDLSLQEIAEQCGISRQGVWENIRRAEAAMNEIEDKTHLVRRMSELRVGLEALADGLRRLVAMSDGAAAELAGDLTVSVYKMLEGESDNGV